MSQGVALFSLCCCLSNTLILKKKKIRQEIQKLNLKKTATRWISEFFVTLIKLYFHSSPLCLQVLESMFKIQILVGENEMDLVWVMFLKGHHGGSVRQSVLAVVQWYAQQAVRPGNNGSQRCSFSHVKAPRTYLSWLKLYSSPFVCFLIFVYLSLVWIFNRKFVTRFNK